jgi:protein AbiQ
MSTKLKFYDIDINYIKYLKQFDKQVPNIQYSTFNKFFCGIVLSINNFNYFAPVTSLKTKQKTNFIIYDKNRPISSIRFSFMIPAYPEVLTLKDFSKEPPTYQDLLNAEIKYCNQKFNDVYQRANQVYKIGTNSNHPLNYTCCNFNLLEEKSIEYISELTKKQIAITNED